MITPANTPSARPAIGIVLASQDEFDVLRPAFETLKDFECAREVFLASVWAAPERLLSWAERAESRGVRVIVATAGAEPQLPGFTAAATRLPVIALPLPQCGVASAPIFELALRTAPAAPVAAVAPGAAHEAMLLAIRILALADPALGKAIDAYRQSLTETLVAQHQALLDESGEEPLAAAPPPPPPPPQELGPVKPRKPAAPPAPLIPPVPARDYFEIPIPASRYDVALDEPPAPVPTDADLESFFSEDDEPVEVRSANLDRPLAGTPALPKSPFAGVPARLLGRRRIDPDTPDYQVIEEAIDCLLEGGVIAFPTETVYGLAADATNPAAVERLFDLKGRPRNKSITLMVDSPKLLGHIACNLTVEARRLMEAFWPGPLTIVFQKRGANFRHVSDKETIGVRLPDHSVPLSIMQALARPLACTSANLAGAPECFTADEVERAFAGKLNLILDGGRLKDNPPSTVIDVASEPYRILRKGAVTREQIAAVVGDKLEDQPEGEE